MAERRVIRGATLLPLDGRRVAKRGDLLLVEGQIAAIGGVDANGALIAETQNVVMPGLVQAHVALDQALLDRRFVPDRDPWRFRGLQLAAWLGAQDADSLLLQARAGLARGLRAGVAAFGDAGRAAARLSAIEAAIEMGARMVAALDATQKDVTRDLDVLGALLEERGVKGRIGLALAAGDAEHTPAAKLRAAAKTALAKNLPLIVRAGGLGGGGGAVDRLRRAEALGKNTVVVGGENGALDRPGDARALADAEASVVLTPAFDLVTGAEPPRLEPLLEAGVNLALGSASGAARTGFDLFREVRLLAGLLRGRAKQPYSTALEIAAKGGARALMLDTGSVQVGKRADLITLDLDLEGADDHEAICARVVEMATPARVKTSWIDGTVVKSGDGRVVLGEVPTEEQEDAVRARYQPPAGRTLASLLHPRPRWNGGRLPFG